MRTPKATVLLAVLLVAGSAAAAVDLVTLPGRQGVQLTIYNSADLTLVRDVRNLTLKQGANRLSFSWANTLIDPTSLDLRALTNAADVDLLDVSYPPRLRQVAVWNVESKIAGEVPTEITFFTSGISWRSFYMATLAADEARMRLDGYVVVTNNSGEDYENAQTRLIVGRINILDQIAMLAQRHPPYGSPAQPMPAAAPAVGERKRVLRAAKDEIAEAEGVVMAQKTAAPPRPKQIVKEGLSEYFIYTIEGTETIPNTWAKRLPSFHQDEIPIENLYKYDENRWGGNVMRFIYFKNDKEHKLGETPLPDGSVKVFRIADQAGGLSYEGACETKYIPVDQKAELNLGPAPNVSVKPTLMKYSLDNFTFDDARNIDGWDETQSWRIEVKNQRDVSARIEIMRHFRHQHWDIQRDEAVEFAKEDLDTVKFTLVMPPHSAKTFSYTVTFREGKRQIR